MPSGLSRGSISLLAMTNGGNDNLMRPATPAVIMRTAGQHQLPITPQGMSSIAKAVPTAPVPSPNPSPTMAWSGYPTHRPAYQGCGSGTGIVLVTSTDLKSAGPTISRYSMSGE
jgi:hypothetical protein